jgi:replicative DNA helicase
MTPLELKADSLIRQGISFLPVKGKTPAREWKYLQSWIPIVDEAAEMFAPVSGADGIAVIGGQVSGGLLVLDFDDAETYAVFRQFGNSIDRMKVLFDTIPVTRTPSGGYHMKFRSPDTAGNEKLASDEDGKVLIETRGEGGYALTSPSPGYEEVHLTDADIPTLSADDTAGILRLCRLFDRRVPGTSGPDVSNYSDKGRPGDDYNKRGDVREVLLAHGWTHQGTRRGGVEFWRKPDSESDAPHATLGIGGTNLFYVFSTSAIPFDSEKAYSPFSVYALLQHDGDYKKAAGTLAEEGYGNQEGEEVLTDPEWGELSSLSSHILPMFPTEILPAWAGNYIRAIADNTQTPADVGAMLWLAIAGACLAKRCRVYPKEGWREPVNLFTVTALPPASRKSAVFAAISEPYTNFEKDSNENTKIGRRLVESKQKALAKQIEKAENEYANCETPETTAIAEEKIRQLYTTLESLPLSKSTQLVADDVTPEKLVSLLSEFGRIAILSDEAGIFGILSGRYSANVNLDPYLKGHSGGVLKVDRVGREDEVVYDPALTLGLSVQPGALEGLTKTRSLDDRGLLARFLYAYPEDNMGVRRYVTDPIPHNTRLDYAASVGIMAAIQRTDEGKEYDLTFDAEAQAYFDDKAQQIEYRLGKGSDLHGIKNWAGKLHGQIARIAAILHVSSDLDTLPDVLLREIPLPTVRKAWYLAEYLIAHAKAAFEEMGSDLTIRRARLIVDYAKRRELSVLHRREVLSGLPTKFHNSEDVDGAAKMLEERGYIKAVRGSKGGQKYLINPAIHTSHSAEDIRQVPMKEFLRNASIQTV